MKITLIEEQKKNKERVSIYIDEAYGFGVSLEILYKYNLKVGMELTEDFISDVIRKEEALKANNYAMNLISMGGLKTEKEIRDRMIKKGFNDDDINNAINLLKDYKYVDDRIYAEYYIKDKLQINGYGKNKIKNDLFRKGVSSETISECLDEFVDDDSQFELAVELGRKKVKTVKTDDFNVLYRKVGSFLQGRGFSFDVIKKVMSVLKDEFNCKDDFY